MGYRLSKIYTRTGDKGETGLGDGSRVAKDDLRIEAFGSIDELNSVIGMVLAHALPSAVRDCLTEVQHRLFDLGGEIAVPGRTLLNGDHVAWLERQLDGFNADLPRLEEFILPAGGPATATCHLARTVARRAERRVVSLQRREDLNPEVVRYLNRLSDLLFVIARLLVRAEHGSEVLWQPGRD